MVARAVQREVVYAVHKLVQRPARAFDGDDALGERLHAKPHRRALAWRQRQRVLVDLEHRIHLQPLAACLLVTLFLGRRVGADQLECGKLQRYVHRIINLHLHVDPFALHARRVRRLHRSRRSFLQPVAAGVRRVGWLERRDQRLPQLRAGRERRLTRLPRSRRDAVVRW